MSAHRLLVAIEEATRNGNGSIVTGLDIHQLAWERELCMRGDTRAAGWTGLLVDRGWLDFGPSHLDRPPRGVVWSDRELQSFHNYFVTSDGSAEAYRTRQAERERLTDDILEAFGTGGGTSSAGFSSAFGRPLDDLRRSLDLARPNAMLGAAKEVVESAARICLSAAGQAPETRASLAGLVKTAAIACGATSTIAQRAASLANEIGEVRNRQGAGHGRSIETEATLAEAMLVAELSVALARFLLSGGVTDG